MIDQFHPAVQAWFAESFSAPTAAQRQGWASIREGRPTLIAAPDRIGQDARRLSERAQRSGLRSRRRTAARRSPRRLCLAAEGAERRRPQEPCRAQARHPSSDGRHGAGAVSRDERRSNGRHDAGRARRHAPHAAAHPGDDAGIVVPAADGGAQPPDAAHRAHRHRRRDSRRDRHAPRRAPRPLARAPPGDRQRPRAAHRPVGDAEADRGGRPVSRRDGRCGRRGTGRLRHRERGPSARDGARRRDSAVVARSRDVERNVGRVLRPPDGLDSGASDDAGVREHAAPCRAPGPRAERAARRRGRDRPPRQPLEGAAFRRRVATQGRHAQGAGGDGVARARDRHRRGRSRLPDRFAAPHRHAPAARGPLGPHRFRDAARPRVPDHPRRSDRVRGARSGRSAAASSIGSSRTTPRSTCCHNSSSRKRPASSTPRTRSSS